MRLICPNCGAQYEVDERVIPDTGRDVQCSACGHAWYQMPFGQDEEPESEAPAPEHDEALEPDTGEAETETAEPPEAVPTPEPEPDAEAEPEEEPEPATPPQREVQEEVRSILKEEAERELSQRATEQVETQPDLGLDSGPSPEEERRRIARERMARMRGLDDDELPDSFPDTDPGAATETAEPEKQVPRRELFPDIEEINSTLDGHGAPGDAAGAAEVGERSGGFGRGFFLMIFLAALLLAVYVLAPNLSQTVPVLEPALSAYVETVNAARVWLDQTLQSLISRIDGMGGEG